MKGEGRVFNNAYDVQVRDRKERKNRIKQESRENGFFAPMYDTAYTVYGEFEFGKIMNAYKEGKGF